MIYVAKFKLAAAIIVAASVVIGGNMQARRVVGEDTTKPPETTGQSEPERSPRIWGGPLAGLTCSISAEKTTYRAGEPILVRFDLKNVSDKPQTVWHCGFWPNHRWIVRDATGRDLELTERGQLCRDCYGPDTPRRKNFPLVVQPGKLDASFGPYDLRRLFEIADGTTIRVRCMYLHNADGKWIEIASNKLSLTIERPSAAENDGVRFEAMVTNRSDELSETGKGGRTKFDLALRITNLTGRALRFGRNRTTTASLKISSDQTYFVMANLAFHRAIPKPKLADYPLVAPGESVTFNAYWRDSQLRLGDEDGVDGFWAFGGMERGEHELLLGYTQRGRDIDVLDDDGATVKIPRDQMWHGSVRLGNGANVGPPIKVLLPGPPPDVRCGAIVDRFWEIPDKAAGKRTKIDMALRIENRTDRALYFSRYDTIWPKLKSASGKTYDLGGGRDATRKPTAADYPLVPPGDGVTFDIDANLYWHDDELRLGGSDGFGGPWFLRGLEPGDYGLYFQFTMPKSRLDRDIEVVGDDGTRVKIPKDQMWTGDKAAIARISLVEPGGSKAVSGRMIPPGFAPASTSRQFVDGPHYRWTVGPGGGDVVDNLEGCIEAKETTIKPGEDIKLTFTLKVADPKQAKSVYVWDNKYSEGYRNDAYVVAAPDGTLHFLQRAVQNNWDKNAPHPVEIKAGKPYVLEGWTGNVKSLKTLGLDTSTPGVYTIYDVYMGTAGKSDFSAAKGINFWGGNIATNTIKVEVK